MRILIDMNLTPRWVPFLRQYGHEAVHWSTLGPVSAMDREICQYARLHGFALMTNDLDFPQILAHTKDASPSIILVRGEPLVPEVRGPALLSALESCREAILSGAIVTLDCSAQPRARVLPLR
jgi:predicted nuclease of predicted toxin-antitoxin system